MEEEHEAVHPDGDREEVAQPAVRPKRIAVLVLDEFDQLIGTAPSEEPFRILRDENLEDLQRLAGITAHAQGAKAALDASTVSRFTRRMPWLIFGLLTSSLVTLVMMGFEHTLSKTRAASFFVPALVYIAGAIGTQAVTVSIRSLSTHEVAIGRLLPDELVVGAGIGTARGMAGAVLVVFGQPPLAFAAVRILPS